MAKAFAPEVSVNCVAPGWIELDADEIERLAEQAAHFAAKRPCAQRERGRRSPGVLFFAAGPHFVTGQILVVDAG